MSGAGAAGARASGVADAPFRDWLASRAARAERALDSLLPPAERAPARLHEAMRYATLGGGKRIRPLLAYAAGEMAGAADAALDAAACAVEFVHAYSLVHDDLPCMDDDVLRRGRPTVHVAYGEALAMLAGDALQALAFESVASAASAGVPAAAVVRMTSELARAAGSLGMAGGQAVDLDAVGGALSREALEDMHRRKTGALLAASVRLGVLAAGADSTAFDDPLRRYAAAIGLAFQVVDDILDVEADSETLGKTAGKDRDHGKPTYVSVIGLESSRRLARELLAQAHAALEPFGARSRRLADLADLIVLRNS